MDPVTVAKLWLAIRPIRRLKERRARKRAEKTGQAVPVETEGVSMLPKGTQTLTGIAVLALVPWAAKYGISSEEVTTWVTAASTVIGGLIAVFGYLRRKKLPAE